MARRLSEDDVTTLAQLHGLPPELALAIYQQETTSGTNTKTSPKGARGGFQVMPDTFKRYMTEGGNIDDPTDNATAAMRVLADGLKQAKGDPRGAAHFYYSGKTKPSNVTSGPGTPTVAGYGDAILAKMARLKQTAPTDVGGGNDNTLASLGPYGGNAPSELDEHLPSLQEEPPPDIAGLTRPLNPSTSGEWLGADNHDYELDSYIRKLVDQEFGNQHA